MRSTVRSLIALSCMSLSLLPLDHARADQSAPATPSFDPQTVIQTCVAHSMLSIARQMLPGARYKTSPKITELFSAWGTEFKIETLEFESDASTSAGMNLLTLNAPALRTYDPYQSDDYRRQLDLYGGYADSSLDGATLFSFEAMLSKRGSPAPRKGAVLGFKEGFPQFSYTIHFPNDTYDEFGNLIRGPVEYRDWRLMAPWANQRLSDAAPLVNIVTGRNSAFTVNTADFVRCMQMLGEGYALE